MQRLQSFNIKNKIRDALKKDIEADQTNQINSQIVGDLLPGPLRAAQAASPVAR